MQISSMDLCMYRPGLTPVGAGARNSGKEDFSSHFSGLDDVKFGYDIYGTPYYETTSPYMRLMEQYERYLAQKKEEYDLPGSYGLTEENLAYLKERFSGNLTWMEREEALDTLVKMGIISNVQRFTAHQDSSVRFEVKGTPEQRHAELMRLFEYQTRHSPLERDWNVLFEGMPIAKLHH